MAEIGKTISNKGLKDYLTLREVALKLKLKPHTLKRWIKEDKIAGLEWGYDRRNWIIIHKKGILLIRRYRDGIRIVRRR
ncbi:MAG: hypothetical protein FJZ87_09105 [Chloroflexi bacterium]|nr:hypothetical protein [Chloroflexota bacterium]